MCGLLTGWLASWLTDWLTGWLTNRLAGWLADWLTNWLTGWMTGWLTDWLAGWLTGRLTGWLADWLTGWLGGWLADWLAYWLLVSCLTDRPSDWLTCWLADKPTELAMLLLTIRLVAVWLTEYTNCSFIIVLTVFLELQRLKLSFYLISILRRSFQNNQNYLHCIHQMVCKSLISTCIFSFLCVKYFYDYELWEYDCILKTLVIISILISYHNCWICFDILWRSEISMSKAPSQINEEEQVNALNCKYHGSSSVAVSIF